MKLVIDPRIHRPDPNSALQPESSSYWAAARDTKFDTGRQSGPNSPSFFNTPKCPRGGSAGLLRYGRLRWVVVCGVGPAEESIVASFATKRPDPNHGQNCLFHDSLAS